ncbi:MAG: hypothetical protein KBT11_06750 [Treponema sp.]|nr:hypothetical protein [Candidatus Treponema equifaecale]
MKSIKKIALASFAASALVFGFAACSDISSGSDDSSEVVKNDATSVLLQVKLPSSAAKVLYTQDEAKSYKITAALAAYSETVTGKPGETLSLTLTKEGEYTITVEAFDTDDATGEAIATGSVTKQLSFSKEVQTVEIKLDGKEKTIDVTISVAWNPDDSNQYVTGQLVKLDGVDYIVISNNVKVNAARSADDGDNSNGETEPTGDEALDLIIEKFASDVFVRKLLKEFDITSYVELMKKPAVDKDWNSEIAIQPNSAGEAYYADKFIIAKEDGTQIAEFDQTWDSSALMDYLVDTNDEYTAKYAAGLTKDSLKTEKAAAFAKITELDLRTVFNPTRFRVFSSKGFENGDLTKKFSRQKVYKYDKNGEVALTKANIKNVNDSLDYQKIDETTKNSYVYKEFYDSEEYSRTDYTLARPTGAEFYSLQSYDYSDSYKRYTVRAAGDGKLNGSTDPDERLNQIDLYFNKTETKFLDFYATKSNKADNNYKRYQISLGNIDATKPLIYQKVSVYQKDSQSGKSVELYKDENSTKYTLIEAVQLEGIKDYIHLSQEVVVVNGLKVPAEISVKSNFSATADFKGEYLNVTLVPVEAGESIIYVPKTDTLNGKSVPTFVKAYSAAFKTAGKSETAYNYADYTKYTCTNCETVYYHNDEVELCDVKEGCGDSSKKVISTSDPVTSKNEDGVEVSTVTVVYANGTKTETATRTDGAGTESEVNVVNVTKYNADGTRLNQVSTKTYTDGTVVVSKTTYRDNLTYTKETDNLKDEKAFADLTNYNYVWGGYYTDEAFTTPATDFAVNTVYYAKWTKVSVESCDLFDVSNYSLSDFNNNGNFGALYKRTGTTSADYVYTKVSGELDFTAPLFSQRGASTLGKIIINSDELNGIEVSFNNDKKVTALKTNTCTYKEALDVNVGDKIPEDISLSHCIRWTAPETGIYFVTVGNGTNSKIPVGTESKGFAALINGRKVIAKTSLNNTNGTVNTDYVMAAEVKAGEQIKLCMFRNGDDGGALRLKKVEFSKGIADSGRNAGNAADFSSLTFDNIYNANVPMILRTGTSGSYEFNTPVTSFSDLSYSENSDKYNPFIGTGTYLLDSAVFTSKNDGSFRINFRKTKENEQNVVTKDVSRIKFNNSSFDPKAIFEEKPELVNTNQIQSYIKIKTTGKGTVKAMVVNSRTTNTEDTTSNSAVMMIDSLGHVLAYQKIDNAYAEKTADNYNESYEFSANVDKAMDVYLVYASDKGTCGVVSFEYDAEEISE